MAMARQRRGVSPIMTLPVPARGTHKIVCTRSMGKRSTGPFPIAISPPEGRYRLTCSELPLFYILESRT